MNTIIGLIILQQNAFVFHESTRESILSYLRGFLWLLPLFAVLGDPARQGFLCLVGEGPGGEGLLRASKVLRRAALAETLVD